MCLSVPKLLCLSVCPETRPGGSGERSYVAVVVVNRTGKLSLTDRQSKLACFFLSAEQAHSDEVRKLYDEKLRKVWTEHFYAASGI